ncbi:MAG: antibiotic biosynthesis monooxygenase, partial [Proteobacteria bacterium]|nr:antibiotic biosynthesis monooxygenase [Pseudomonadota bacterium]
VFDVLEMREEPDTFLLYEVYESQAALEDHKQTPHYKACRAVVADLIERQTVLKSDVIAMNPSR